MVFKVVSALLTILDYKKAHVDNWDKCRRVRNNNNTHTRARAHARTLAP